MNRRRPSCGLVSFGALFAAAALATSCSRQPEDPVARLLAGVEDAVEARDAEALGQYLSADFAARHGLGRSQALDQARRYFAGYESIEIAIVQEETELEASSGFVRCVIEFSGNARRILGLEGLLPPEAVYRFELTLRLEGDAWRVSRADWMPVVGPATPSEN